MSEEQPHEGFGAEDKATNGGVLGWMAQNSVAANILMFMLIVGGLVMITKIKQEVFPEFELDTVLIQVPYPGASPEEVEQGVILPIEEAVRAVDGIKEVSSTASEGNGVVYLELLLSADPDRTLADVKSAVDRITSFPRDVEEPVVSRPAFRSEVISLIVYGHASEALLRDHADRVREDLLQDDGITTIELSGIRPLEISVEISQDRLRAYGLTYRQVADAIEDASIDLPAGSVRTEAGEVLIRTTERRDRGEEFENIVVLSRPDGTRVRVGDLGRVVDGFQEIDRAASYEGQPAVMVKVFRVGDQTPLDISATVNEYIEEHQGDLPPGLHYATWNDQSEFYEDRINLLLKNAYLGLMLVLVCLGLFLEIRLAFWVTLGIPISFIGSLLFMPMTAASINMISLFAFILTLGMVVDDAIVAGESIYKRLQEGIPPLKAAIGGVKEVATPIVFAILTTCIFFAPLMFVPGVFGKFFIQIPIVVILVLLLSLAESLLILPAHLAHLDKTHIWLWGILIVDVVIGVPASKFFLGEVPVPVFFVAGACIALLIATYWKALSNAQQRFSRLIEWLIDNTYRPVLTRAVRHRYTTVACGIAILLGSCGLVGGGRVQSTFFPRIDGDIAAAKIQLPFGTPVEDTEAVQRRVMDASRAVVADIGGDQGEETVRGRFSLLGSFGASDGGPGGGLAQASGSHLAEVAVSLVPSDQRPYSTRAFTERWREEVGEVPGVESLTFTAQTGGPGGEPIDFELSHSNLDTLERAAAQLAEGMRAYAGTRDIDDGFSEGKEQLDFTLRPEARARGITESILARQLRAAFYGAEAVRQQRGRDEVRVFVRRPRDERTSLADVERMLIRTPNGGEIPLSEAAEIRRGRAYTSIRRLDGRRRVNVTADVDEDANADQIVERAQAELVPQLREAYPNLRIELGGDQKRQQETQQALLTGFILALLAIYGLLAIAFRSYIQPFIIISVIPFGLVGAIVGHLLLNFDLSLMSFMGLVALSGVVVNDSLVLISAVNDMRRDRGMDHRSAVITGGVRRFRPILLTSLTTFLGLTPMILESSVGARFLIPMAISLGFGVLFATFITLLMVPAVYEIVEDVKFVGGWVSTRLNEGWAALRNQPLDGER